MPKNSLITYESPSLYSCTSGGSVRFWQVKSSKEGVVTTTWGSVAANDEEYKVQESSYIAVPKGKETIESQAKKEAIALEKKQLRKKYSYTMEGAIKPRIIPMKAKVYDPAKAEFPCDVQPKLDGVRCTARRVGKEVELLSYGGLKYTVPHISEMLRAVVPDGVVLDGELYSHGLRLQEIISLAKRNRRASECLRFNVFDCIRLAADGSPMPDSWKSRRLRLATINEACGYQLNLVETMNANSAEEVVNYHNEKVAAGYEGCIVRNHKGVYKFNHRGWDMMKFKDFQDDEFEVIGVIADKRGAAIIECITTDGQKFSCPLCIPLEEQKLVARTAQHWIGMMLKVRFLYYSEDGVPILPKGICKRPVGV